MSHYLDRLIFLSFSLFLEVAIKYIFVFRTENSNQKLILRKLSKYPDFEDPIQDYNFLFEGVFCLSLRIYSCSISTGHRIEDEPLYRVFSFEYINHHQGIHHQLIHYTYTDQLISCHPLISKAKTYRILVDSE